jgi:hypothetical protein
MRDGCMDDITNQESYISTVTRGACNMHVAAVRTSESLAPVHVIQCQLSKRYSVVLRVRRKKKKKKFSYTAVQPPVLQ